MKRRSFLKSSSLISLPVVFGGVPMAAIERSSLFDMIGSDTDKVLILIQLNGGNDGLNTMIPLDQYDNLVKVRENIIVPEHEIIDIGSDNGFHPSWSGMKTLLDEEKLKVIQSVGYPDQNRSHFRSTDIWQTASHSDEYLSTGWLGRYLDLKVPGYPMGYPNEECPDPFAMTMGTVVSETCQGLADNYSFVLSSPEALTELDEFAGGEIGDGCYAKELSFVRETVRQANAYAENVIAAYELGTNYSEYENTSLSQQMKTIARLIAGGSQTRIYVASIGGFDTHAYQVDGPSSPANAVSHATLLQQVSDAITAFQEDIEAQGNGERVVGMTFSEFGRRIRSNNALGTDHGNAAPLFVFGNCVQAGVLGSNPEISEDVGVEEGVPMQYDFRSVYGSILIDWFDLDEAQVKQILFEDFQYIPMLKSCSTTATDEATSPGLMANVYPNPTSDYALLDFISYGGKVHISILDSLGRQIKVLTNKQLTKGSHTMKLDLTGYVVGAFFIRISEGSKAETKRLVKI